MGDFRGYISRQYTAWCGGCGNWEQVDEELKSAALKRLVKRGWRQTKENGWVCPRCMRLKT
jgi:hypothetical protein